MPRRLDEVIGCLPECERATIEARALKLIAEELACRSPRDERRFQLRVQTRRGKPEPC